MSDSGDVLARNSRVRYPIGKRIGISFDMVRLGNVSKVIVNEEEMWEIRNTDGMLMRMINTNMMNRLHMFEVVHNPNQI